MNRARNDEKEEKKPVGDLEVISYSTVPLSRSREHFVSFFFRFGFNLFESCDIEDRRSNRRHTLKATTIKYRMKYAKRREIKYKKILHVQRQHRNETEEI